LRQSFKASRSSRSFAEYLKSKEEPRGEWHQWTQFSRESTMRGIAEEATLYELKGIEEKL